MMRKLLFLLVMFPVCCMAQSRYCVTWQDFLMVSGENPRAG